MNDCRFCSMLEAGPLQAQLPNLVIETATAVVAVNRRPVAPGHLTIILKDHLGHTGEMRDETWSGVGSLLGRLSAILEARHRPGRVILLGDGKRSAHLHLHLIPEPAASAVSLPAAIADLIQTTREPTLSPEEVAELVRYLRAALA